MTYRTADSATACAGALTVALALLACASGSSAAPANAGVFAQASSVQRAAGSLRREDITLRLQLTGVQAHAVPLDSSIISLLAPDAYRALRELMVSRARRIDSIALVQGRQRFAIWHIAFYGLEQDARFSPADVVINSAGRDYQPLEIIPLTQGFGRQSIGQREQQAALYLFDPALDASQPLELRMNSTRNTDWTGILSIIERERARVRAARVDTTVNASTQGTGQW